ncbi:serine/threonine-protein kinase [Egicoccus sp. AB-alg2]|uniref:serine/threonine-protein kinase n=1 Tax=Egicoccus sp. AB-alg2 TaxID=3242693 RepID=UPI00359D92EB
MDDTTTSQQLAGRYVLHDQLGSGGAGSVWRAHDEVLDRTVAVKLLHRELAREPETAARFRAEAAAAAKLTHPHAVIVYDIGTSDGCDYLVMELVEGGTLGDVLAQGPLPAGVAAALGAQIARALGTAHGRGLVHRDVKPANVLVTRDGIAKVADFGIARALGEATSRLTTPGQVVGTARYLAPEQLRDEAIDARADVYALGLLLHQMVTGRQPFGDGTAVEVAARRLVADGLPRVSTLMAGVPPALDDVIARATALEPDDRYTDGSALAAALAPLAAPQAATELASRIRRVRRTPTAATPPITPPSRADAAAAGTAALPPLEGEAAAPVSRPAASPDEAEATRRHRPVGVAAGGAGRAAATGTGAGGGHVDRTSALTAEPDVDDAPQDTGRRRRWLPVLAVLAALLLGVWLVWSGVFGGDGDDLADDTDAPAEDPADDEPAQAEPLQIQQAGDHDPFGGGSENPDQVDNAFDGDPGTTWRTVGYNNNPALGGLKPGVGLWVDLGDTHTLDEVVVTTEHPGYDLTVYVGDEPPSGGDDPDAWGEAVGTVGDGSAEEAISLDDGTEGRTVLLWFTSLGPDDGRFRGSVAEVEVHGS